MTQFYIKVKNLTFGDFWAKLGPFEAKFYTNVVSSEL